MHGIILLNDVGAGFTSAQNADDNNDTNANDNATVKGAGVNPAHTNKTVGDIVGAYKSLVANECLKQFKLNNQNEMMGKLWQRNYHENIIRNEQSYQRISEYIINNPKKWNGDKFYNE